MSLEGVKTCAQEHMMEIVYISKKNSYVDSSCQQ